MNLLQITEPSDENNESSNEIAVGIDLGTTNSLIAIYRNKEVEIINGIVPSTFNILDGKIVIGDRSDGAVRSIKRLMGKAVHQICSLIGIDKFNYNKSSTQDIEINVDGKIFTPEIISAEILRHLKKLAENYTGQEIHKAVITVPAYFDELARNATKNAAKIAGLEVLRLLNEPTAAAVAYGLDQGAKGFYLIYDLGGGTFDVSLLKLTDGVFKVLATSGDSNFGGDDIDDAILKYILSQRSDLILTQNNISILLKTVQEMKHKLSENKQVEYSAIIDSKNYDFILTKDELNKIITPSINKTITLVQDCLASASILAQDLDGIILVGGSTRIPLIKEKLSIITAQVFDHIDPDILVVRGAAVQASNLISGQGNILLDVTPLSLGIEIMGGLFERVIQKNTTIPCKFTKTYTTYEDGQTAISIHVLQGEREMAKDCRSLAKFIFKDLTPLPAGAAKIDISFIVDADGLLTVEATDQLSGKKVNTSVKPSFGMTPEKLHEILTLAYANAKDDLEMSKLAQKIFEGEKLIKDLTKLMQNDIELLKPEEHNLFNDKIADLQKAINMQNIENIAALIKEIETVSTDFIDRRTNHYLVNFVGGKAVSDVEKILQENKQ